MDWYESRINVLLGNIRVIEEKIDRLKEDIEHNDNLIRGYLAKKYDLDEDTIDYEEGYCKDGGICVYNIDEDYCRDFCLNCGQPFERK